MRRAAITLAALAACSSERAPQVAARGRDVIWVGFDAEDLADPRLSSRFERLGESRDVPIRANGRIVAWLHYRVGYGYRERAGR